MTLNEICRLHKIEVPEADIRGNVKFVFRPGMDPNTYRAFMVASDFVIDMIHDVHPQERETVVVMRPK